MPSKLRSLTAIVGFVAMISTSTASIAADDSASWAALGAMSSSTAQDSPARNSQGLPSGTSFFSGAALPIGVIIAAGILAVVLASRGNGNGRGRGFSPS